MGPQIYKKKGMGAGRPAHLYQRPWEITKTEFWIFPEAHTELLYIFIFENIQNLQEWGTLKLHPKIKFVCYGMWGSIAGSMFHVGDAPNFTY